MQKRITISLTLAALFAVPALSRAEVAIQQAADKSVAVKTGVYTAQIDAKGNLAELAVKGAKSITHQFGDPGKPPAEAPSINVIGQMVAVRSGTMRVEWTFGEDTIGFLTEGYNFECLLDPSVKMLVKPGGGGGALGKFNGGSAAVVLANDLTMASKSSMHAHERRYLPSAYISGGVKPGTQFENELRLGAPADAAQTLSSIAIKPVGADNYTYPAALLAAGNAGGNLVHFPDPKKISFTLSQQNLGKSPMAFEYRAIVLDHYVAGKEVAKWNKQVTLPGETVAEEAMPMELPAGFYYLTIAAWRGEAKLSETRLTFTVDLPHYTRPLTRPADFTEFWKAKVEALRALPFDEKLTEAPEKSTEAAIWYDLELTIAPGKPVRTVLQVPRRPGKYLARFGDGDKATDANTVFLQFPISEVGSMTFSRWVSRDDNNMLDSYLFALRLTDYLRSRPEVDRIYLGGASRTGPVMFVNAALDPTRIAAVDIHVPTSAGISWTDKPYQGWGHPDHHNPADPAHVRRWAAMAAYVDPVNFAPEMKVPWITAYGLDDNLSQPQGIEAMFHLSPSPWKRISRDGGGHQYSPGFQKLQKDLAAQVQATAAPATDKRILKDH